VSPPSHLFHSTFQTWRCLEKIAQDAAKDFSVFLWLLVDVTDAVSDVQGHSWQEAEGCQQS